VNMRHEFHFYLEIFFRTILVLVNI
jgi:hypothetical protein